MAGTINSLGIGSGVLTADVIDQLKGNEKSLLVTPIENKIVLSKQKSQAVDLLGSLMTAFESNVAALNDDGLYQQRTVSGNNDSVSVTASAGVAVQSFSISDTQLALENVKESGSFAATTTKVASGTGTMTINIDGSDYAIDYDATTTLEDLKDEINNVAGASVSASILQVGENDQRLILKSNNTGADQTITITDSAVGSLNRGLYSQSETLVTQTFADSDVTPVAAGAGTFEVTIGGVTTGPIAYDGTTTLDQLAAAINAQVGSTVASVKEVGTNAFSLVLESTVAGEDTTLALTDLGGLLDAKITGYSNQDYASEVQTARDATFKYNGITITRDSNEIDDIVVGMTINLLEDAGSANISISQDVDVIAAELSGLTESYNSLARELDNMTLANVEEGKIGIFNGDSTINSISRKITSLITSVNGDGLSLPQFGISIDQSGTMSFEESDFKSKMAEDPTAAELFFSGGSVTDDNGDTTEVEGVFNMLETLMEDYTGTNGIIGILKSAQSNSTKSLAEEHTLALARLDARYDTMTARFIKYDALISKLNNQFSSLQQQIQMAINAK